MQFICRIFRYSLGQCEKQSYSLEHLPYLRDLGFESCQVLGFSYYLHRGDAIVMILPTLTVPLAVTHVICTE